MAPVLGEVSSSDEDDRVVSSTRRNQRATKNGSKNGPKNGPARNGTKADDGKKKKAVVGKSWETSLNADKDLDEIEDGADLAARLEARIELRKRQRLRPDTEPFQRGIIRHVVLVIDMTIAMTEKDMRPNRFLVQLRYAQDFVQEFFEQNPISQLAIVGMHDGIAVMISDLSGKPDDHQMALLAVRAGTILSSAVVGVPITTKVIPREPKGKPSLQNALEMARALLYHTPTHGTRETIIILGALLSVDPTDIHETIGACVRDRIKVNIIGMNARLRICSEICGRTNNGDEENTYGIAMDGLHLKELLFKMTTPPLVRATKRTVPTPDGGVATVQAATAASLLQMGFPSRIGVSHSASASTTEPANGSAEDSAAAAAPAALCACHGNICREGYTCPRCQVRVCALPVGCPSCGLTLVLSTHLARSYHHLFPLPNFVAVEWDRALDRGMRKCAGCLHPFPDPPPDVLADWRDRGPAEEDGAKDRDGERGGEGGPDKMDTDGTDGTEGSDRNDATPAASPVKLVASESSRYECLSCKSHFCVDCDLFCHQTLHNCPGCLGMASGSAREWGPRVWDDLDG